MLRNIDDTTVLSLRGTKQSPLFLQVLEIDSFLAMTIMILLRNISN